MKKRIMKKEKRYISNCCGVFLPHWDTSDFCPRCGEHCEGELVGSAEELEESTSTSSLEEEGFDLLIEAFQIFRKYSNSYSPTHCEHDELRVMIDPAIVSQEDKKKLEGRGFMVADGEPCFISYRFGSA